MYIKSAARRHVGLLLLAFPPLLLAEDAAAPDPGDGRLETVVVTGDRVLRELPELDGTRILAGKRTSVAVLTDIPPIEGMNLRQAFATIQGLLVSEVSNASWQSVSFRGLGEPHESWNTLTLQDGIPVSPDLYSYPAAYYVPPLDAVERVEFLRGGASLIYGPLPGGSINYVTRRPTRTEGVGGSVKLTGGSFDQRAILLGGDVASGGLRAWFWYRQAQGEGPRRTNSDADQASLLARIEYTAESWRVTAGFDHYRGEFGEPGGLTRERWLADDRGVSTPLDRFFTERTAPFLAAEGASGDWWWSARAFASDFERTSIRQAGGSFGQPTPAVNVRIRQLQSFDGFGAEARLRRDLALGDARHAVTVGVLSWDSDAPVFVDKEASPASGIGTAALARTQRDGRTTAAFAEMKLDLGRLQLVPGLRYEQVDQAVREQLDLGTGSVTGGPPGAQNGTLSARDSRQNILLWGLGLTYELGDTLKGIVNVSRAFKPRLFNDGVTFQSGVDVAGSLEATYAYSYEAGLKARPRPWLALEAALFQVELQNQVGLLGGPLPASAPFGAVGTGGARRMTVGSMRNRGADLVGSMRLLGPEGGLLGEGAGELTIAANVQMLFDAEFTAGLAAGQRPQYAPEWLARASLSWVPHTGPELAVFATYTSSQSGVDNGRPEFAIPSAFVVDATARWSLTQRLSLLAGVNNLSDARYVSRVRPGAGGGIDPGLPRNGYVGVSYAY